VRSGSFAFSCGVAGRYAERRERQNAPSP
jgi:hypothetical protein